MESSATVTGSTDQPTIIWLHDGDEISPTDHTRMVSPPTLRSSHNYSSTLTFNPLLTSHAGTYTCTAMVGSVVKSATVVVTVQSECSLQVMMYFGQLCRAKERNKHEDVSAWNQNVLNFVSFFHCGQFSLSPAQYHVITVQ